MLRQRPGARHPSYGLPILGFTGPAPSLDALALPLRAWGLWSKPWVWTLLIFAKNTPTVA